MDGKTGRGELGSSPRKKTKKDMKNRNFVSLDLSSVHHRQFPSSSADQIDFNASE
jgi:hypothetical protein